MPTADELQEIANNGRYATGAGALLWAAVVYVWKIFSTAMEVSSVGCSVIELTGNGNPCDYVTMAILSSMADASSAKYEVKQYIYKDPACPYPPYSSQCSLPPYAYYKTYLSRI